MPSLSLRSSMSLKSQEIAQGTMPRLWGELSFPIMVYDLPGRQGHVRTTADSLQSALKSPVSSGNCPGSSGPTQKASPASSHSETSAFWCGLPQLPVRRPLPHPHQPWRTTPFFNQGQARRWQQPKWRIVRRHHGCRGVTEHLPRFMWPKEKMQPSAPPTTDWSTSATVPEQTSA